MSAKRADVWDAINEYVRTCGGDTSDKTVSVERMEAVAKIERALDRETAQAYSWLDEALNSGDGTYRP